MKSQILISAISSGSGKTILTLGLLRALRNRGLEAQSFKCGPDYIDTKFHKLASGKDAINLDLFLSSSVHVQNIYQKYTDNCDVSVTEGVMGLFDGYDKMAGSSAQIAEFLNIPIVLIINAKSMAYTMAPLLYGLKNFYPNIKIVGAIFNRVNTESHYRFLSDACKDAGIRPLGYLPTNEKLEVPSRHLGLSIDSTLLFDEFANQAATFIEQHLDIDQLLHLTTIKEPLRNTENKNNPENISNPNLNIAVASDEAFNFYYKENIEYLKKLGEVVFFSPLQDNELPKADFVYLPGGYPELFLEQLSANHNMRASIRNYIDSGGKLLAECGGMMYLSTSIANREGREYDMVGVFEQKATMQGMKLKLGYRQFVYRDVTIKGHEFHYSNTNSDLGSIVQQYSAKQIPVDTKLLRSKNVLAGYTHIYWAEIDDLMALFEVEI